MLQSRQAHPQGPIFVPLLPWKGLGPHRMCCVSSGNSGCALRSLPARSTGSYTPAGGAGSVSSSLYCIDNGCLPLTGLPSCLVGSHRLIWKPEGVTRSQRGASSRASFGVAVAATAQQLAASSSQGFFWDRQPFPFFIS